MNATTTAVATQNANGLMSAADKKKLDGLASSSAASGTRTMTAYSNSCMALETSSSKAYVKNGICFVYLEATTKAYTTAWTTIGYINGVVNDIACIVRVPCAGGAVATFRFLPQSANNRIEVMAMGPSNGGVAAVTTAFPCT